MGFVALQRGEDGARVAFTGDLARRSQRVRRYWRDMFESKAQVVVTDIQMPFWSMVRFMLKWSVATIPAAIVLVCAAFGALVILSLIAAMLGVPINVPR